MPHREFVCHDCHRGFLKTLTAEDYEEGDISCPRCGSENVELRLKLPDSSTKKTA